MSVDKSVLESMIRTASALLKEKSDELCRIDARLGDGDHGVTIKKIAEAIENALAGSGGTALKPALVSVANAAMAVSGGAAAPLWGTMLGGLHLPLEDGAESIAPLLLKEMFASSLKEMQGITNAKIGDKTMMDALIPAVEAARTAADVTGEILEAAALAAGDGARKSTDFMASVGRAKNYKERSIGIPDPGAVSLSIFFEGLDRGYKASRP